MRIGLVRRGYSSSGGAEAYLFRFANAARAAGHEPVLICSSEWPREVWPHDMVVVAGRTPGEFADRLEDRRASGGWDVLFSLERVWACDVYRAGDGVHSAWLDRRAQFEPAWRGWFRKFQRKHREIIELECALFTGGARRVIANSQMVKDEIIRLYGTPAEHVHVIHNGVPTHSAEPGAREKVRADIGLAPADYVAVFAGTGWDRKGLRHAVALDLVDATGHGARGGEIVGLQVELQHAIVRQHRRHSALDRGAFGHPTRGQVVDLHLAATRRSAGTTDDQVALGQRVDLPVGATQSGRQQHAAAQALGVAGRGNVDIDALAGLGKSRKIRADDRQGHHQTD